MTSITTFGPSIASSAMLVNLSVGNWTARKLDRKVSEDVDKQNNTQGRAGNYHKNLLAGAHQLDLINKFVAGVRNRHHHLTLPWADSGPRLLAMKRFFDYKAEADTWIAKYTEMKQEFCVSYPTMVSAAAFQLGGMFDRNEYPEVEQIERKFYMEINFWPVPETGDFRVDCEMEIRNELNESYRQLYDKQVATAMGDAWSRLHGVLSHLVDRLTEGEEGDRKVFHASMIDKANELIDTLDSMNITNDTKLENARASLAAAIAGVSVKDLRDSKAVRYDVRTQVEDILSKFAF
jgi:hypothetical protein